MPAPQPAATFGPWENSFGWVWDIATLMVVPMTQPGGSGGGDASAANQVTGNTSLSSIDGKLPALVGGRIPVVLPAGGGGLTDAELRATAVPVSVSGVATAAKQDTGNTSVGSIDTKTPALGQALAASSVPVVLTAAQITTLTPPAAIAGFALEAGHLAAIDTATARIPAQGQALAAASLPMVMTAIQIAAITPDVALSTRLKPADTLAAVTNLAQLGGAAVSMNTGVRDAGTQRVTIATNDVVPVTDNAGSLTVDAPVGTPVFVRLSDGSAAIATLPVSLAALPALVAGSANIGDVDVLTVNGQAPAFGTGTRSAATQRVTVATDDVVPVSGTVTANPATYFGKTLTYVPVAQGAAGTTQLAAADASKKHKLVGCILTLDVVGTLKFTDTAADLTGAMDVSATGGFVIPTSLLPMTETTAINKTFNIVTTGGKAKGVVVLLTEA